MTGTVIFADRRGFGEIRCDELGTRVRFQADQLVKMKFATSLGKTVAFDLGTDGRAVRIRAAEREGDEQNAVTRDA